ncbi:MAG: hypothetical protein SFV19_05710 [Rhodospirillaceae bacterium]|nr:hypothetical protein [Rhodospirillaceae bacterium]
MGEFSDKERKRFRRLLEVAHSTTFDGEREAALGAATRLAEANGMTLREAAGMSGEDEEVAHAKRAPTPPRPRPEPWMRGATPDDLAFAMRQRGAHRPPPRFKSDLEAQAADKLRYEAALADAIRRGLDAEERRRKERLAAIELSARRRSSKSWRPRGEFVRVLLKETKMTVQEIAATAGVSVYDVFREKLLLRRAA